MAITRRRRSAQPAPSSSSDDPSIVVEVSASDDAHSDVEQQPSVQDDSGDTAMQDVATPSYDDAGDPWTTVYQQLGRVRSPQAAAMQLRPSLQAVCDNLHGQLAQLIEQGISNSALVIGPRGSGKTLAVERALHRLCTAHNTNPHDPAIAVVRLSGLVHTDERSMVFGFDFVKHASFDSNILFVQELMTQLHSARKSVIFVMDEFDALVRGGKQTVLYTLVDAMRHTQAQAAIVAVSTCHDVFETLEKRVQSRFVHSKLGVDWYSYSQEPGECIGDLLKSMLSVPLGLDHAAAHNNAVAAAVDSPSAKEALRKLSLHCTVRDVASVACAVTTAAVAQGVLRPAHIANAVAAHAAAVDGMVTTCIPDLSIVEAFVLVACARCATPDPRSLEEHAVRFGAVWEQLSRLAAAKEGIDAITGRSTALRAFECLANRSLLAPANAAKRQSRATWLEHAPMELRVSRREIQQGLQEHPNAPQLLMTWLTQHAVAHASALDDVDV